MPSSCVFHLKKKISPKIFGPHCVHVNRSSSKVLVCLHISTKLELSQQIFETSSYIKLLDSLMTSRSRHANRYDEASSCFSQFCERALKKKVHILYRTICSRISKISSTLKIVSCLRISSEMYCLSIHKAYYLNSWRLKLHYVTVRTFCTIINMPLTYSLQGAESFLRS